MRKIYIMVVITLLLNLITCRALASDSLWITVSPATVEFHVEDMSGRISGFTDTDFLYQIPYLDGYKSNSEVGVENPTTYQKWSELYTSSSDLQVLSGNHKLFIYSTGITSETMVEISIDIHRVNGSAINYARILPVEYIFPGLTYVFEFDIPATPPANHGLTFIKVSNPNDLIADINALGIAKHMGDQHFVSELIKEINEIEAEKAKGKMDDGLTPAQKAKKEYQELFKELNEKNTQPEKDEYVDELALYILQRDIDYIIDHIQ